MLTRYDLTVFKVFREPAGGRLPGAVLLAGGSLGNQREEVSSSPHLAAGQQGVFFLEADPQHPGEWWLFAGPQGLIGYDLSRAHGHGALRCQYSHLAGGRARGHLFLLQAL